MPYKITSEMRLWLLQVTGRRSNQMHKKNLIKQWLGNNELQVGSALCLLRRRLKTPLRTLKAKPDVTLAGDTRVGPELVGDTQPFPRTRTCQSRPQLSKHQLTHRHEPKKVAGKVAVCTKSSRKVQIL